MPGLLPEAVAALANMVECAVVAGGAGAERGREDHRVASGARTVRLLNAFPSPAAHVGHTMRATGLLVRDAGDDAVNVLSLEMLAPSCAP